MASSDKSLHIRIHALATDPDDRGVRGLRAEWASEHGDPSRPDHQAHQNCSEKSPSCASDGNAREILERVGLRAQ
jgi:hypothetical protein